MKIRIGEIFRVSRSVEVAATGRGTIWSSRAVATRPRRTLPRGSGLTRTSFWQASPRSDSSVMLHSNPLKEGSEVTPWIDIVEAHLGYAFYNGEIEEWAASGGSTGQRASHSLAGAGYGPITSKRCSAGSSFLHSERSTAIGRDTGDFWVRCAD